MAATSRRSRTRDTNIWPGFVDALATLLMVIIFVLMVFIVAQFYLTQLLSGRDEALGRLQRQISELGELLALERETGAELRLNVAQLSSELQASIAARDSLASQIGLLTNQRDQLEERLAAAVSSQAAMRQRIVEIESSREGLDSHITQVLSERDALLAKLRAVEMDTSLFKADRDELRAGMDDAMKILEANRETIKANYETIEANRDTIKVQLSDLESLRRDIAALNKAREALEGEVTELAAVRTLLENELRDSLSATERTQRELEIQRESARLSRQELAAIAEKLKLRENQLEAARQTGDLTDRDLEEAREMLASMLARIAAARHANQELEHENKAREASIAELAALLGDSRDQTKALTAKLAEADRRTTLAQETIEERDIRLEELLSNYDLSREQLTKQERISAAAQRQVTLLNQQLLALRQQIASLQQTLEASEAETVAQNVQILDLGKRLNMALASKVQELARFRSEFFGRLREVLENRRDIRIVGDRFVFQSEVLFESGSATIAFDGVSELRRLAAALNEIGPRIPENINWILQVEGHTDSIPIFNEQFRNNWDLSAARAISVVQFLIRQGVPAERLSATGYGEFQPIDESHDEIGNRRNRRIEMKLTQR
jgi:chemotaxis protein MotB